ncbi:MAG: hypothetical protein NXI32_07880 [bacterium]|nr:hypothetical protein [bacterium]
MNRKPISAVLNCLPSLAVAVLCGLLWDCSAVRAEVTEEQQQRLQQLADSMQRAGKLYSDQQYGECAREVLDLRDKLQKLLADAMPQEPDSDLLRSVKPIYDRLERAYGMLELQGAELPPLTPWAELSAAGQSRSLTEKASRPLVPGESPQMTGDASDQESIASDQSKDSQTGVASGPISFARDIAPLLIENCNGCHLDGRRASGNLRMDTYEQMMRGGDSGELIAGRNATNSLLIQRLKGEAGERMPAGGRPALSPEQITTISTWIREGATFDGDDPSTELRRVVQENWAAAASHDDLFQERKSRSLADWQRVLPDSQPASAGGNELFILGNVSEQSLNGLLTYAEAALGQAKKLLGAPQRAPLIKGGISIFVLQTKYDYGEFGRMVENRDLPSDWTGHWYAGPLDVYAALPLDAELSEKQGEAIMLQVLVGAYLGSFRDVPYWFSEGVARNAVLSTYRRADPRVKTWQASLAAAFQKVDSPKTLLEDRLDEESAGLVGMALTGIMTNSTNRMRFEKLLALLREGRSFNDALTFAYAPPETLLKNWLGKK